MIATSGFLTALECTKFVIGRGSAPDPAGGAYSAPPDPLAGLRGALLLRGRGGEGTGGEWEGTGGEGERTGGEGKGTGGEGKGTGGEGEGREGKGEEGRERREGKGRRRDWPPLLEIPGSAPANCCSIISNVDIGLTV